MLRFILNFDRVSDSGHISQTVSYRPPLHFLSLGFVVVFGLFENSFDFIYFVKGA